jgi:hypothetical protein
VWCRFSFLCCFRFFLFWSGLGSDIEDDPVHELPELNIVLFSA